ncbi:MAG: DUF2786 domain-containing protein [Propionibacteriaceae bacterium]|nr:DUF2786 domain-containing protein [Propionibacteriaceae bacterium]
MDYAEKIKALLAKAASTPHDAERDSFTEAAERLMVKWGVDDAMLAAATGNNKADQIEQRRYHVPGTSGALLAELVGAIVAPAVAPVRTLFTPGRPYWWAIGYPDDLARIELYAPKIMDQARYAWRTHLHDMRGIGWGYSDGERRRARIAFLTGFANAVHIRLAAMFTAETEATSGAELVLRDRSDEVNAHVDALGYGKSRGRILGDAYAFRQGDKAGSEADLSAGALA